MDEDIKNEIETAFKESVGHGNFTSRGWASTMGITMPSAIRLKKYLGATMTVLQLLMVLNFLKEYRTEAAAALSFGYRSDSTYEKYIWTCLRLLDYHLPEVLIFVFPRISSF
jgi:hypothetical protein